MPQQQKHAVFNVVVCVVTALTYVILLVKNSTNSGFLEASIQTFANRLRSDRLSFPDDSQNVAFKISQERWIMVDVFLVHVMLRTVALQAVAVNCEGDLLVS